MFTAVFIFMLILERLRKYSAYNKYMKIFDILQYQIAEGLSYHILIIPKYLPLDWSIGIRDKRRGTIN